MRATREGPCNGRRSGSRSRETPRRWRTAGCSVGSSSGVAARPRCRSARGKSDWTASPNRGTTTVDRLDLSEFGGGHEVRPLHRGALAPRLSPFPRHPNAPARGHRRSERSAQARVPTTIRPVGADRLRARRAARPAASTAGPALGYRTPQGPVDGRSLRLAFCFFQKQLEWPALKCLQKLVSA